MHEITFNRRRFLGAAAMTFAASQTGSTGSAVAQSGSNEIRPFKANIPDQALVDLRRRLAATRWPDQETVTDRSQGTQLATLQELVRYWADGWDWRKIEAQLNSFPQFMTEIDGLDIHFIHVRSRHPNALPVIMTHGWPGSIFEMLKVIDPLTNPTAHGGTAADAFDLVVPSMPGHGFSAKPRTTDRRAENPRGTVDRMSRAWAVLMGRLGYKKYVAQGGDWGSVVSEVMARQAPVGLAGIHVNMPAAVPPEIATALTRGDPPPAGLSADEKIAYAGMNALYTKGAGYAGIMVDRPQTLGYSLADSPVGMAGWYYDKFADWTYTDGHPERELTKDEMLNEISLYWLTNTGASSARLYWENGANNFNAADVEGRQLGGLSLPVAVTVFPGEIYQAPRSWCERAYKNLIYYNKVDKGGHFAAWEQPELFSSEIRAAFRSLR
jgi:pimeloyl-ACP methyl ester carboxylesterase